MSRLLAGAALLALVVAAAVLLVVRDEDGGPGIAAETYAEVVLGIDAEALVERLLPARPVELQVDRSMEREPEPAALRDGCLYYAAEGRADLRYRFCFEDDRLVRADVQPTP